MSASEQIDGIIAGLNDWRGPVLARIRTIIREADPAVDEQVKWRGAPVWSHGGDVCVATVLKAKVKLTFPQGARLADPDGLFNNGLGGGQWRAIDVFENAGIDGSALRTLVRAAVEYNRDRATAGPATRPRAARSKRPD